MEAPLDVLWHERELGEHGEMAWERMGGARGDVFLSHLTRRRRMGAAYGSSVGGVRSATVAFFFTHFGLWASRLEVV
jgi:hypothetical protein